MYSLGGKSIISFVEPFEPVEPVNNCNNCKKSIKMKYRNCYDCADKQKLQRVYYNTDDIDIKVCKSERLSYDRKLKLWYSKSLIHPFFENRIIKV